MRAMSCHSGALLEPWWSLSIPGRAFNWRVDEFPVLLDASQHQSPAAHVTSTDEFERKMKPIAELRLENIHVFAGCDAAEKHRVK
jgi:hypothetical protein